VSAYIGKVATSAARVANHTRLSEVSVLAHPDGVLVRLGKGTRVGDRGIGSVESVVLSRGVLDGMDPDDLFTAIEAVAVRL
jgi:hypothetical protein